MSEPLTHLRTARTQRIKGHGRGARIRAGRRPDRSGMRARKPRRVTSSIILAKRLGGEDLHVSESCDAYKSGVRQDEHPEAFVEGGWPEALHPKHDDVDPLEGGFEGLFPSQQEFQVDERTARIVRGLRARG